MIFFFSGQVERERVHAAVPLWRLLLVPQVEGARVQKHHLDRGVRRSTTQGQDRQLHSNLLDGRRRFILHRRKMLLTSFI